MPLVRIELIAGRSEGEVSAIADAIHQAIVSCYGIPIRDRFQVITQHSSSEIFAQDAGLGFERDAGFVLIQIFTQRGRSADAKQVLYAEIAHALGALGVSGSNVFIGYHENGPEDWSFGFGRAQYLTGELDVPRMP